MPPSLAAGASLKNHHGSSTKEQQCRVILLLDLDCFYAQCECIRLGLDATVTPLALMQWNSALAVTYPARERFQIKRGDGWEGIQKKSKQNQPQQQQQQNKKQNPNENDDTNKKENGTTFDECLAIHVPIFTTSDGNDNDSDADIASETIQDEYNRIFGLTVEEKERCRLQELGVRKFSHQGKASIERYRIASARIFTAVLEYCQTVDSSIVLERASIDEFFIDVTRAVYASSSSSSSSAVSSLLDADSTVDVRQGTVIVGKQGQDPTGQRRDDGGIDGGLDDDDDEDQEHVQALWRGCAIAHGIRKAVRQQLGFTLSAGIGPNKSIAKLSASYGKPNGQALTLPKHVAYLLNQTPISSCRNLGGKRGKQIQALLPMNVPTTVGSIARYLSLPDLQHKLSHDAGSSSSSSNTEQAHALAVWVYNLARGIDHELVVSKNESALLTKSITAFKALPHSNSGHSLADAMPWLLLLAKELSSRVERDAARHARYPRQCTIYYDIVSSTLSSPPSRKSSNNTTGRTIRMPFPLARLSTQQKIQDLSTKPLLLIGNKEQNQNNHLRIARIGLCAVDFVYRDVSTRSIDSYFQASATSTTAASATANNKNDEAAVVVPDELFPQTATIHEVAATILSSTAPARKPETSRTSTLDSDLELAKKMQKEFDREQRVLETMDAGKNKKKSKARRSSSSTSRTSSSQPDQKTRRIDSFFSKR